MAELRIPISTYRVQFNLHFRFVDGRDLVPYLNALGITDLYSSPRFKARRGSPHAYDVANPLRINSELGTEEEFDELAQKLRAYGMGLLLDIVPNHMATGPENPWWMDVLENGRASVHAAHFAVDWERAFTKSTATGKIVLPILGDLYGKVLEDGEFALKIDENGFFVKYYSHRLPLDPKSYALVLSHCGGALDATGADIEPLLQAIEELPFSTTDVNAIRERHARKEELKARIWMLYNNVPAFKAALDECLVQLGGMKGDPGSFDALDRILSRQCYRLAYWRVAGEELNYRRFFDINDLVGIRVEDPEVFKARHPEIVQLVNAGRATGFRIDHIDGLWEPAAYLHRLRTHATGEDGRYYTVVEKILTGNEELPRQWETYGTTGYDFLNQVNGLFVDQAGVAALSKVYRHFTGVAASFADVRYERKKQVMTELFSGEVNALGFHLGKLAGADRYARDLPFQELSKALVEVTARLPVYRTYIREFSVEPRDQEILAGALQDARTNSTGITPEAFDFLRRVFALEIPHYVENKHAWLHFVMDWQQFTGAVMAKGFEDTACYVYNRLISQNEVGSSPEIADAPLDAAGLHSCNMARLARSPYTLNATSTHDTKRSEDVRARIDALSEIPAIWGRKLAKWSTWNQSKRQRFDGDFAPSRNDEIALYQTLLGAWPLCGEDIASFSERIKNYAQKAAREAKTHTNWLRPNEDYEKALFAFVDAILEQSAANSFLRDFIVFQKRIAKAGAVNSLSQTLLKIASPGIPDFYQGTELWDFSLVDPDNRRPVDFGKRAALLDELKRRESQNLAALLKELDASWEDGRIKLYLTYKALNFRRARNDLFALGEYVPIAAEHTCAFLRRGEGAWALIAVPRLSGVPAARRKRLLDLSIWKDARLALPDEPPRSWKNVLTAEEISAESGSLPLADLFARFPVALLEAA